MKTILSAVVVLCFAACAAAWCAVADRRRGPARGKAAFYGEGYRGARMANGERFDPDRRTCASFDYALGTVLRVECLRTGRSVVVVVTDRGPAVRLGRLIDLSERAFAMIAPTKWGVIEVEVSVLMAAPDEEGAP